MANGMTCTISHTYIQSSTFNHLLSNIQTHAIETLTYHIQSSDDLER